MADLLQDKKALVTGAGRGIGAAIARRLAREGAAVALAYHTSGADAENLAAEIRAAGGTAAALQADLTRADEAKQLAQNARQALGGLDILVNNAAGFGTPRRLIETHWADLDHEWQSVVAPVFHITRAVLPGFVAQRSGCIVNLAATLVQRPASGYGAHTMAKAAVLAFTQTLAREVGPDEIRVNAVSPGMTRTEFTQSLPVAKREEVAARTPLRRLATPEDVAAAVALLCSPLAQFITGANIAPDGGLAVL